MFPVSLRVHILNFKYILLLTKILAFFEGGGPLKKFSTGFKWFGHVSYLITSLCIDFQVHTPPNKDFDIYRGGDPKKNLRKIFLLYYEYTY